MNRWAVILAGGVGSRFWPLSTPQRPKQLLPLVDDAPLLVNTVRRLAPAVPAERMLVITNASLADAIRSLLPALPFENVIAEPRAAGTGPALTWAALEIQRRDSETAVMLCVHADWAIADEVGFRATLEAAAGQLARAYTYEPRRHVHEPVELGAHGVQGLCLYSDRRTGRLYAFSTIGSGQVTARTTTKMAMCHGLRAPMGNSSRSAQVPGGWCGVHRTCRIW